MKAGSPAISVLLPVHNGSRFLRAAIESVLEQDFTDFELIVVDDGSTDGTHDIVAAFAQADSRVRCISAGRIGLVASLETGRAAARAPLIARMDADDIALPSRLGRQKSYLDAHPGIVALGGQLKKVDAHGRVIGQGRYPIAPEDCRRYLRMGSPLCHPAVMMRAGALEACGGYRQNYAAAEDYDLWQRMAARGDLANLADTVLLYRVHDTNLTLRNATANAAAAALSLLDNSHHGLGPSADQPRIATRRDPNAIERDLPEALRAEFLQHYVRFLVLNGGIGAVDDPLAQLRAYATRHDVSDAEKAFTLARAAKVLLARRRLSEAAGALTIAARRCPRPLLTHVLRHLAGIRPGY